MSTNLTNVNNLLTPVTASSGAQSSYGGAPADNSRQVAFAIPGLPDTVTTCIFEYLTPKELGQAARVSHDFKRLSSDEALWNRFDLNKVFPFPRNIIDKAVWERCVHVEAFGLDLGNFTPFEKLSQRAQISALYPFATLPIEKINGVNPGVTLLTIPAGLTINKLGLIAQSPKSGNVTGFRYIWDRITAKYGDVPVGKTYQVVIVNNIFEGTRDKTYNDQKAFVEGCGCQMLTLVEAITLAFLTYISSGALQTRLFGDNPSIYTRVLEKVSNSDYSLVVGGFSPRGLHVNFIVFDYDYLGVSGLRKFST